MNNNAFKLLLFLFILVFACENEIEELEGLESSDSEPFSTIDFSTFKDNIKHKDIKNSDINKLLNNQTLSFGHLRFKSQPENFIISIDSTDVLMAEKDGVTSYTFRTQTADMSKTTNYVLAHDDNNNTDEYYLSYGEDGSSHIIDPVSGLSFTPKSRSIWCPISREVWVCVCAGHEPGNCVGICSGGFHQITIVTNEPCPSGGGEDGGGGPGDGGTGGNGNGDGEGTGGGSGDGASSGSDLPIDGPIVTKPRKFEQEYEECLSGNYDSTICDCVAEGNSLEDCHYTFYLENPEDFIEALNFEIQEEARPIENIEEFLDCFNDGKEVGNYGYIIYVDQPVNGTRKVFNYTEATPGHTFFSLFKNNTDGTTVQQTIGFYPANNDYKDGSEWDGPGIFQDNGYIDDEHDFDMYITFDDITSEQFQNIIGDIINIASSEYDLDNNNCTNVAHNLAVDNLNFNMNPSTSAIPILPGAGVCINPGDYGEDLRDMYNDPNNPYSGFIGFKIDEYDKPLTSNGPCD